MIVLGMEDEATPVVDMSRLDNVLIVTSMGPDDSEATAAEPKPAAPAGP